MNDASCAPPLALRGCSSAAVGARLRQLIDRLVAHQRAFAIPASMTLILLMEASGDAWYLSVPLTALCIVGLLYRSLLQAASFWLAITALLAGANYQSWYIIDNHKYLIVYWCLAIYASRESRAPARVLSMSARWLIGLCFLFATLWKIISPDYASGAFFYFELLTDPRFANVASFVTGVAPEILARNAHTLQSLTAFDSALSSVQLQDAPGLLALAHGMTWWTIGIEGLLATTFLLPDRKLSRVARNAALFVFLISTYSNAPVLGFGWVLAVMGMAQSRLRSGTMCLLYLVAFLVIWIYGIPWSALTYGAIGVRIPLAR